MAAIGTVSNPTIVTDVPFMGKTPWCVNGLDSDCSTAKTVKAAPGAGLSLYITSVMLSSVDADAFPQLQDNTGTPVVIFGPLYTATAGSVVSMVFKDPIKLAENKQLDLKCAAAGAVSVFVTGFTAAG